MYTMIENRNNRNDLSGRNKRLAIILGLMAATIYGGYILVFYFWR
jgi:tetrahydromethanopterin S-methyltransferase subunit F